MKSAKKWMGLLVTALVTGFAVAMAYGATETVGEVTWKYSYSTKYRTAKVTGANPATGDITIPSSLGGYLVTSIGGGAFQECSGLRAVTIPNSVTNIGSQAFQGCSGLTAVTIPSSVTNIGSQAFLKCNALTALTIPDSVTNIGSQAFASCSCLTNIMVGTGNMHYSSQDGVLFTKSGAHLICCPGGKTGEYTVPDNVTSFESFAFFGCSGLSMVSIPAGVTSFGSYTFRNCSGLHSVVIPASVTNIGLLVFDGCRNLDSIVVETNNMHYASKDGVLFTKSGSWLLCCPSKKTGVYNIPFGVTGIDQYAFAGCHELLAVTIPDSVTRIDDMAFSGCSPSIYDTTSIAGVTLVDGWAVGTTDSLSGTIDLTGVRGIGHGAFYSCDGLTSVTIADSVKHIGGYAFAYCRNLTSLTIGASVTSIGYDAFSNCKGLTSVTIPDSVTNIESYAFSRCQSLTSVTIPSSVRSIGKEAFSRCSSLTTLTIPISVLNIGEKVFEYCNAIETLYVPVEWKSKYVNGTFWSSYATVPAESQVIYYKNSEVLDALIGALDFRLVERIANIDEYTDFVDWANRLRGQDGELAGMEAVLTSKNAWSLWLLGAETLFEHEPEILIVGIETGQEMLDDKSRIAASDLLTLRVQLLDGEKVAFGDATKVASLVHATDNLLDWKGNRLEHTIVLDGTETDGTMIFTIRMNAGQAFLQIRE